MLHITTDLAWRGLRLAYAQIWLQACSSGEVGFRRGVRRGSVEELTACLETNTDPLMELDKVEGDGFLKLLESLLDCNSEEPGCGTCSR